MNTAFIAYELAKRAWQEAHPQASPEEHEQAMRAIAKALKV